MFLKKLLNREHKIVYNLFLLGFFVLSPISSFITIQLLKLPTSLPEILFIFFIPFLLNNFTFKNPFNHKQIYILIIIWFVLVILGGLNFNLYGVLSTARTYLYIFFFYSLFNLSTNFSIRDAFIVSFGALVGWFLESVYNFRTVLILSDDTIVYGPMIAIPIAITYVLISRKIGTLVFLIIIGIATGILSGLRREIAVVAVSLFIGCLLMLSVTKKKTGRLIVLGIFFCAGLYFSYPLLSDLIQDNSDYLYRRIILKSENLFSGNADDGDSNRQYLIKKYFNTYYEDFLPQGFVTKQFNTGDKDAKGGYMDVPIRELSASITFLFAFILILYFIVISYRLWKLIRCQKSYIGNLCFISGIIVMLLLLFLEGSFITFPYAAPYTGYVLGRANFLSSNYNRTTKKISLSN